MKGIHDIVQPLRAAEGEGEYRVAGRADGAARAGEPGPGADDDAIAAWVRRRGGRAGVGRGRAAALWADPQVAALSPKELAARIKELEKEMYARARDLEYEEAARLRDEIAVLRELLHTAETG